MLLINLLNLLVLVVDIRALIRLFLLILLLHSFAIVRPNIIIRLIPLVNALEGRPLIVENAG